MTKTEILTEVQNRTGRGTSITSIDTELDIILKDITVRFDFLKDTKAINLSEGENEYSILSDFEIIGIKNILSITDSNNYEVKEIKDMATFLYYNSMENTGEPVFFYRFSQDKILFYPVPDDDYVFNIYYSYIHPQQDTILLNDEFKQCVIDGVCYEIYKGKGIPEQGTAHKQSYEDELKKLISMYPIDNVKVEYRDV